MGRKRRVKRIRYGIKNKGIKKKEHEKDEEVHHEKPTRKDRKDVTKNALEEKIGVRRR